jgi:glycosyltransferase involved in cell wall biosynthesis
VNITHFVENLNRGGLERMVLDLIRLQQGQGHRCQVVCLYEAGALAHELADAGIPLHACGKRRGLDLRALMRARRALREHATDVLHTHNAVAHYQAVLASRGLRLRRVINTRHGMGGNRRAARREWLYRRALGCTDTVVAVCEAARADAVARGIVPVAKARVVPNGIRVESFQPASMAMHARLCQALGLSATTQVVGTVGRLNWTKDQDTLIRAFARVHAALPDTALVLIGDGELRVALEQRARDAGVAASVHFLGDRNDVCELLQGLDVFALSSVSEGYSMALLEACAVALPIVATDVGGNREIVQEGRTGRLLAAGDPAVLAELLLALLRAPVEARALGQAARAWVQDCGSLEAMAARYGALYAPTREPAAS